MIGLQILIHDLLTNLILVQRLFNYLWLIYLLWTLIINEILILCKLCGEIILILIYIVVCFISIPSFLILLSKDKLLAFLQEIVINLIILLEFFQKLFLLEMLLSVYLVIVILLMLNVLFLILSWFQILLVLMVLFLIVFQN